MQPHNGVGNIGQDGIGGALFCAQERERRFHPRVSVLAELNQVTVVELGFTGGLLLDISAGGIAVQAAHPIEQGVTLGVKFLLPFNGYPVEATCAVAWSDGGHAGLKFAPLSEIAQRKLGLWVQAYGTRRPDRREIEASPIEVGQEVTTDPESRTPTTSAARRAESASPRQNVVPDLAECDPVGVGDDPQSMMGADAAVIALGDDRDVVRETSSAVESPRPDRRGSRRSLISVPMWARWKSDREHEMKIYSRDISDGGIFFHVNCDIAIGTEVEVTFTVPSDPGAAGNKRLRVQGTVIRSERQADGGGCALRITSSELLETDDLVTQARLAVSRVTNNDSPGGQSPVVRTQVLPIAYRLLALTLLASLAGVVAFVALYAGGPANAADALREMVAGALSARKHAPPDVLQSGIERKPKVLPSGPIRATQRNTRSSPAQHPAKTPDAPAVQVRSMVDPTVQSGAVSFNNNNVLTLNLNQGRPGLTQAYVGELPSLPTKPMVAGSLRSIAPPAATANSTAVVLRVVVRRDGTVKDAQRAGGSVEWAPAAIAAIRHWKFNPDPRNSGARRREMYVTVHFTISSD